jgi:hypothetical protein
MGMADHLTTADVPPAYWDLAGKLMDGPATALSSKAPGMCASLVTPGAPRIGVIGTTHAAYLRYLRQCLDSVDSQDVAAADRIVTFDGCVPPEWWQEHYGDRGWRAICGTWGTPNPARNAAIAELAVGRLPRGNLREHRRCRPPYWDRVRRHQLLRRFGARAEAAAHA